MSAETKAVVEVAVAAHMADEMNGAICTAWWLVMAGSDMARPSETSYFYDGPDTQPFHVSIGLNVMATSFLGQEYRG